MAEPGHKRTSRSAACSRRAPLKRRRTRARKHNNKQVPLGAGAGSDEGGLALTECSRPKRRRVTARGVESAAAAADFSWRPILVPFVIGSRDRRRPLRRLFEANCLLPRGPPASRLTCGPRLSANRDASEPPERERGRIIVGRVF